MPKKVAGLLFSERLRRLAAQAGFDRVYFVSPNPSGKDEASARDLSRLTGEACLVALKKGYLPDSRYLKSLKALGQSKGQFATGENSPFLVCKTGDAGEWLRKFFLHKDAFDLFRELEREFPAKTVPEPEGTLYELASAGQIPRVEKLLFKALVKDTEGFMSRHVERKVSLAISGLLVETAITPNQMTVISVLIGLAGAVLMGIRQGAPQIAGALLFLAHSILDGCDGEIARIKFLQSRFGGLLDYWGDNVVHSAIFFALALEWSRRAGAFYPHVLGGLAIFGTLASASWIYWKTMREKEGDGPLYTSVSTNREKSKVAEVADFLSRRDFIYLVVVLAIFQKLDWFLALSAAGAPFFFLVLLWIHFKERPAVS